MAINWVIHHLSNYTFDQLDSPVISGPYERHATPKVTPKHNDAVKVCLKLHLDKKDIVGVQIYYNYVLTEHHTKITIHTPTPL